MLTDFFISLFDQLVRKLLVLSIIEDYSIFVLLTFAENILKLSH